MMTRKTIKLFSSDKSGILCYQGECKLTIDARFSKALIVEPKNKEFLDICAFFRWKFIQKKNLLFGFAELNVQDFVLIFANEEICQKVGNIICRYKEEDEDYIEEDEFQQRLLIPIFQKLPQNFSTRFKRIIIQWIEKHEDEERMELIKLYKKRHIQMMDIKNVKQEPNARNPRKRRFSEIQNNGGLESGQENMNSRTVELNAVKNEENSLNVVSSKRKRSGLSFIKIIDESCFKIVNVKRGNGFRRKLLIFTSSEKTQCYEYNFYSKKQIFYHKCHEKAIVTIAALELDNSGNECVKFENRPHLCAALNFHAKEYGEMKKIKKPDYQLLIYCSNTKTKKLLIIFDSKDKNQCFEYYWNYLNMKFQCRGCALKRKCVAAELVHEGTDNEYTRLLKEDNVCEMRKYDPKKYPEFREVILPGNFEIQKSIAGNKQDTLIVFKGNDRKEAYYYQFRSYYGFYYCNSCTQKGKTVFARICQNDNDENYVQLSNVKHVCSPKEYIPQEVVDIRAPKIKLIEGNAKFISRIIIFASNDNQFCYSFYKCYEQNSQRFYCIGCKTESNINCFAFLCKENEIDGGEYYVKMINSHICQPQKYQPEKYETKILKPLEDYVLFQKKVNIVAVALVIYHSSDKNLCYEFYYDKNQKVFRCAACQKKKACFTAKIRQTSDGNEYIAISNQKKHICKPIVVSSIITTDTVRLENSGLSVAEEISKKNNEIVKASEFMIFNRNDEKKTKLVIFTSSTKEWCYEYSFVSSENRFRCCGCNILKKSFRAKLITESNKEDYVQLLKTQHFCTPKKFVLEEFQPKIIPESGFKLLSSTHGKPNSKLILFDSEKDGFCYQYNLKHYKRFYCYTCKMKNKCVTAELCEKKNGEKFLELSAENHVCESVKYENEIIKSGYFVLQHNISGVRDSIVSILDESDKIFGYQFYLKQKYFWCYGCKSKLFKMEIDKEGNHYLERNKNHECSIQNLKERNLVFDDFKFEENGNILITIHPNINDRFYKFKYDNEIGGFCCIKCKKEKKKFVTATVCNGSDGKEFCLLNNKHFCTAFSK